MPQPRIQDYAVIGDCRSAALVSREGSIDWLCWPRFDSPSLFGALLDDGAGRWSLRPAAPFRTERWYIEGTNVLQTRFVTESGSLLLTDLMPVASEDEKRTTYLPDHELLRVAECERGELELETAFEPAPGYGGRAAALRDRGVLGLRLEAPGGTMTLRADARLEPRGAGARARTRLRAGERACFSLTFAVHWPEVLPPLGAASLEAVRRSSDWWSGWSSGLRYEGPARRAVVRSALALKLLVYAPSGAVVAAPTTSLPERLGGDLNWDYRYCWLRDASLTVRALFGLGARDEAQAFVDWLLYTTRLTRPALRILYDVYGNSPPRERELGRLAGYRSSRPVRVGNAAIGQLQLDVYGEVVDAATHFVLSGGTLDRDTRRMLFSFGDYVCRHWREPDEGIWEPRSGRARHTHSLVLCWTALDRLLRLHEKGHLGGGPVERLREARDLIRREVREKAWSPALRSYVSTLGGGQLDASLLLMPWYGFEPASSRRMKATYARIRERLGAGRGLLYRYRTGDSPGEGAFGVCCFWGAEYLALGGGSAEEAEVAFLGLLRYANDVGLFAEEIEPGTGEALGNFPQAFTHVGLINAALSLERRRRREEPLRRTLEPARAAEEARA